MKDKDSIPPVIFLKGLFKVTNAIFIAKRPQNDN